MAALRVGRQAGGRAGGHRVAAAAHVLGGSPGGRTWPAQTPLVMPASRRRRRIVSTRAGCSTWPSMRWPGATAAENTTRGTAGGAAAPAPTAAAAVAAALTALALTLDPGLLLRLEDPLAAAPIARLSNEGSLPTAARSEPACGGILARSGDLAASSRDGSLPTGRPARPSPTCPRSCRKRCAAAGRSEQCQAGPRGGRRCANSPQDPTLTRSRSAAPSGWAPAPPPCTAGCGMADCRWAWQHA